MHRFLWLIFVYKIAILIRALQHIKPEERQKICQPLSAGLESVVE